jgi:hypothetical protein
VNAYYAAELQEPVTNLAQIRAHRWSTSIANPNHRYYDFRQHPELIRTSLEDFLVWSDLPAIKVFYQMLEWLNGSNSHFETNDCGLRPISQNTDHQFPFGLRITARLMFFYRDYVLNRSQEKVAWLSSNLIFAAQRIDPEFLQGVIGLHHMPTAFDDDLDSESVRIGIVQQMSFWGYGNSNEEVWVNLERVFKNAFEALKQTSAALA